MTGRPAGAGPWLLALRVFDAPRHTFAVLSARPRWAVPLALTVLSAGVLAFGLPTETLREGARRQVEAIRARSPDALTALEAAEMVATAPGLPNRLIVLGSEVAITFMGWVLVAAVLSVAFGTVSGRPIKVWDELALVAHAYLPQLLGVLLTVVALRASGARVLELPFGGSLFSPAFLADRQADPVLWTFLGQFGLFAAWNVYLLALANQIKTEAARLRGPLALLGGLWILSNVALTAVTTWLRAG